jgi:hypothetical protein
MDGKEAERTDGAFMEDGEGSPRRHVKARRVREVGSENAFKKAPSPFVERGADMVATLV